ncbi:glycerophosphodiester phosphodiesterase [Allostreptomyces psammosilenae]|uniref:Glycerophosphoryl diester phosphodiesterase n=1 Tax=Allostreptomyces psammosilenae TaxID=1892865 RepID=A0A852ZNV4_9ACTN|nr:glycerophosphodiester phosphodiesterase family protein [Allostreptomyces psammosilenae]NYI03375.1 glycerophosphoryl diester phosphodiesterase [Allostreptomyces psammosilenae]
MTSDLRTRAGWSSRGLRAGLVAAAVAALLPTASSVGAQAADAPTGAEPTAAVISEDFSGGGLPAGWRAVEGEWTVRDGRLHGTSSSSSQQSRITFGPHLENFRIEATVRFESVLNAARWTAFGLDMAADGSTPWSIATVRSGSTASNGLEFAQRTTANTWNVTDTAAAPSAAGTGRDVHLAVEVHGNKARWFFDGAEALRTTRVARSADGGLGLVVNGAHVSFDDVTVTPLSDNGYLRPPGAAPTVIAHRGASSAAPENTIVANEVARRAGADLLEIDVQPSADGVPVVIHDSTVDRTTDGSGAVRKLTAAQIGALDAGSWFAPSFAGEEVPTFEAVLEDLRARGGDLLLEIKGAHSREEVATLVELIRAYGLTDRVFVQSFEVAALQYTRELAPELPLGLLRSTLDADPVAISRQLGLSAYNPSDAALATRPDVVDALHAAGVAVMVWTVDSPARWEALDAAGVDGIITNRPAELVGWNAAPRVEEPVAAEPTVRLAGLADGTVLDRAQRVRVDALATDAEDVRITVDGEEVAAGTELDLATMERGQHVVAATATGAGGTATATASFTLEASVTGLVRLVLDAEASAKDTEKMIDMIGAADYDKLADWADKHAGAELDAELARRLAEEARALGEA